MLLQNPKNVNGLEEPVTFDDIQKRFCLVV